MIILFKTIIGTIIFPLSLSGICLPFRARADKTLDHLVAAAARWGGLPRTTAFYIMGSVDKNDGKMPHMEKSNEGVLQH